MRTIIIIVGGFVLLGACIGVARMFGNKSPTATSAAAKNFYRTLVRRSYNQHVDWRRASGLLVHG